MRSRSSCVFQAEPDGAAFAEQPLRNRAIGFAGEVCIERAKGERQSAASRRREVIGGAINRLRSDGPPQTKRGVRTGGEMLIEWHDGRSRCSGRGAGDEHNGSAILEDEILAIACGAPEQESKGRDAVGFTEFLGRGRKKNDSRSKMRQPNRRCSVRTLVWVERETSDPSG